MESLLQVDQLNILIITLIIVLGLVMFLNVGSFVVAFWYIRTTIRRDDRREQAEQERREKSLESLIRSSSALQVVANRLETIGHEMGKIGEQMELHDHRMREEHRVLMDECFSRRGIGKQ